MKIYTVFFTICFVGLAAGAVHKAVRVPAPTPDPSVKGVTIIAPAPEYDCKANGAFPHEEKCDWFYDCYNDIAFLMACTDNTLFETEFFSCEEADKVDCGERERPPGPTGPTTTTTRRPGSSIPGEPECTPDNHGAYFPHELFCEQYFQCDQYDAILHFCPGDQLFDLTFMGCNFPEQVDCGDRARPTPASPNPGTDGPGYDCKENGAFPHENCEKYWDCYEGVATLLSCKDDWLFDTRWAGCETPEEVDCGDRIRPTGATGPIRTTTPAGTGPTTTRTTTTGRPVTGDPGEFICPQPDGQFADPEDCSAYYACSNDIPHRQVCPRPLHWHDGNKVCDFPANVSCGDRPIPT